MLLLNSSLSSDDRLGLFLSISLLRVGIVCVDAFSVVDAVGVRAALARYAIDIIGRCKTRAAWHAVEARRRVVARAAGLAGPVDLT